METVELRPMTLGELLDRTFRLYRSHFLLFVSIMAIPAAFSVPANVLALTFQGSFMNSIAANPGHPPVLPSLDLILGLVLAYGLLIVIYGVTYSIAVAAATTAVADVYLGRGSTLHGAYGKIRGRFWRLMGVVGNVFIRAAGLLVLVMAAMFGVTAALQRVGQSSPGTLAVLGLGLLALVFAYLGAMVWAVYLVLRYAVSIPVLMLEDLGVLASIRRSIFLTRGRRGHIFLTLLVAAVIAYVGIAVFQLPFLVVTMVATLQGHWPPWLAFAASLSGAVGSALSGPVSMIAIVLLYYDVRIRKEAFDLQFMMASLDDRAPATGSLA